MTDDIKIADPAYYKVMIDAPIDRVWSELVATDKALPFFFGSVCTADKLEVGAPVRLRSPNLKYTSVVGEVLEFDPPYRYAHTFKFTNMDDPYCTVIYELKEVGEQTEFTLITENVPADTKTEKSMAQGGDFITANLKSYVETGKPTFGGRMILGMIKLMTPFTPKKCLSENWP